MSSAKRRPFCLGLVVLNVISFQMSASPRMVTRPGRERDIGRIIEMVHEEGWLVPIEQMVRDALLHGVVSVTTDNEDHILSEYPQRTHGVMITSLLRQNDVVLT